MFRHYRLLAVLVLGAPAAVAQSPDTAQPQMTPGSHLTFRDRFEAANTPHDGRLTLAQAQAANMHGVVRHFTEMDGDKKGYVTLQDVRAWHLAQRAAKAPQPTPTPTPPQ